MEKDSRPYEIFLDKHDVCLRKNEKGQYYPFVYKNLKGQWVVPLEGDIIFDWIVYVKRVIGTEVNPLTNKIIDGNLNPIQWGASINTLIRCIGYKTEIFDYEWSRQTGKSYLLEHIQNFLTVFGRRYKSKLKGNKWRTISVSFKKDSVKKNFLGVRNGIKKAVNFYNELYGSQYHKLVYGNYTLENGDSKNTTDKDDLLRIDCIVAPNKSVEWSEAYAITANTENDGLSAEIVVSDESILIDAKQFMRSILPFLSANGGSLICTGIASTNNACLQYVVHNMDSSIKFIYTWLDYYRILKVVDPVQAEVYKTSIEVQINACGGHESTEALTNYYMSWEISDGRFTNRTQLEKNNVYQTIIGDINYNATYIVGGLDLSLVNDYTAMVISEAWKSEFSFNRYGKPETEEGYNHFVKEFIVYNLDKMRMDARILAEKVAKDCLKYRLDMLLIDNTASQNVQIQMIQEQVDKLGINTLLVPFNFSGSDKAKVGMVGYAETVLFSGMCKIPLESYKSSYKPYEIFLDEILSLRKEKQTNKQNIQIKAPKGKTDDLCMAFFMSLYCVQHVINLKSKNKLIEIGTKKIFPRLNKFKLLSEIENKKERQYLYANVF